MRPFFVNSLKNDSGLEDRVSVKEFILDVLHKITLQVKKSLCNLFPSKNGLRQGGINILNNEYNTYTIA